MADIARTLHSVVNGEGVPLVVTLRAGDNLGLCLFTDLKNTKIIK